MSKLQEMAESAYSWIDGTIVATTCTKKDCGTFYFKGPDCRGTTAENWLHINGFPASRPHIHNVAKLAQQIIKGCGLPCMTQWIAQHVEAVTCPGCGKHTLRRERRMVCTGCNSVYLADKWANGEPCDCGCMDARYYGIHSANRLGQLEFQQCETPGCRWGGDYRRLTAQELADLAQEEADEQWDVKDIAGGGQP